MGDPSRWFTPSELAASAPYHRALGRLRTARLAAEIAVPLGFVLFGVAEWLVRPYPPAMWADRALTVALALELVALPHRSILGGWEELVHERHHPRPRSSQGPPFDGTPREWAPADGSPREEVSWGRCMVVAGCASLARLVGATALIVAGLALVRGTPWWPLLVGGGAGAALLVIGALYPLVAAPLVDRAGPLDDPALVRRIDALTARAGVGRITTLVARAESARGEGAYLAGFGRARRLVLSAPVLDGPPSGVDAVVAHELGHWSLGHQRRSLAFTGVVLAGLVVLLWLVSLWGRDLGTTPADARLLPAFLLVALLSGVAGRLLLAAHSRQQERAADAFAAALLDDPAALSGHLRRVVVDAGADLQPTPWRRLLSSHPPPAERLAAALAVTSRRGRTDGVPEVAPR